MKLKAILLFAILSGSLAQAQTENSSLTYHVELGATAETVRTPHCGSQETVTD